MLTFSVLGLVPALAWAAFVVLVTYTAFRRILRRRRPSLVLRVRNDVARALKALTEFSAGVHLPDDARAEFERRRMRLQETLDARLDFAVSAKNGQASDAFSFWWEEANLRVSLWTLRRFVPVTLNAFRRETASQIHEWAIHAESDADEQYLLAEDRALRLPQEPVCQMALTHLVPAYKALKPTAARVLNPSGAEPAPEDVRALDALVQDIRRWSAIVRDVNHTTDIPHASDRPVRERKWMIQ